MHSLYRDAGVLVTPLRGILERVLLGTTDTNDCAALVAVPKLCRPCVRGTNWHTLPMWWPSLRGDLIVLWWNMHKGTKSGRQQS